jgi:hypothetical protein
MIKELHKDQGFIESNMYMMLYKERKRKRRIHIYEVSLRRRRETSENGEKIRDKYILVKSHFADEERLRGKFLRGRRETSETERERKRILTNTSL